MNLQGLRLLFDCVKGDLRRDRHLPRNQNELTLFEKMAGYFWQIVELVDPTLFFPKRLPLALDRMALFFPTSSVVLASYMGEPFEEFKDDVSLEDPTLANEYKLGFFLAHKQWEAVTKDGITPRKSYFSTFPEHPIKGTPVTTWREKKGDQVSTKTMGAGMFLVAGTLATELGLGSEPQFVSSIYLLWEEGALLVIWKTASGPLVSTWPIVGDFIFSGVADAGLVQALLDLPEGPQSENPTQFTMKRVSTTTAYAGAKISTNWKDRKEVLPCASECFHWWSHPHSIQWQRRIKHDARSRVVDHDKITPRLFKKSGAPFQGIGLFLSAVQSVNNKKTPKPALYTVPLNVEEDIQRKSGYSVFSMARFGRVQQSIFDKWNSRTKPTSVPTLLCDTHDNFKRVDTRLNEGPVGPDWDWVAISYTWSEWEGKVEELRSYILEVTKEIGVRYAWVDDWCMDEDMKKDEIPRMGEYYTGASAVIVLLPDVEKRTAYTNLTHGVPFGIRKARADDAALGQAILRSNWRSRVWTLQEGLLAQNCIVKTRHQILDGEYLDHLLHFPDHCIGAEWASLGHTHSLHSPVTNVRGYWKNDALKAYNCTFGNRLWWHTGRQSAVSDANKASLLEALKMGHGHQCKEPLDSVIGLLGLVDGPAPPPISAKTETWNSLWKMLIRSEIVGADVLRIGGACQDKGMSWAPAQIDVTSPLDIVGIDGEMHAQNVKLTDHGLEVTGTPVEVVVGEEHEGMMMERGLNQRDITIVVDHGDEISTIGQVSANTGDEFAGIALESQTGDKGITVLLGEWKDSIGDMRLFRRHTSMNVVRVLKLVRAVESVQQVWITIG